MAPLTDSFIDDLLARRVVKGFELLIPGFEELDASQEAQVIAKLQYVPKKPSQFSKGRQVEREGILEPGFDPKALEDALSLVLIL
jgi:hypothetical protein